MRQRIELLRALQHRDRLVVALERRAEASVEVVGIGAARAQLQRPLERLLGTGPVELAHGLEVPHGAVRRAQVGIDVAVRSAAASVARR